MMADKMPAVSRVWKAYTSRSKWYRVFLVFLVVSCIFDFAVGKWQLGLFMAGFVMTNWISSTPMSKAEEDMDWSWGRWANSLFSGMLVLGIFTYLLLDLDVSLFIMSAIFIALLIVGLVAMFYVTKLSLRMKRAEYSSVMYEILSKKYPVELPNPLTASLPANKTWGELWDEAEELTKKQITEESEQWLQVKMKPSRKVALARVGTRPTEALKPEVVALTMEDLAVYDALQHQLHGLASDMPEGK